MIHTNTPILGIAAHSGTGKTTLLEQLLPLLKQQGLRIGMVKSSHHTIEPDTEGKDSYRLRHAGAQQLVLSTPERSICYTEYHYSHHRNLDEQLSLLNPELLDLILVEGFREAPIPKIELHRADYERPYLYQDDSNVVAIAWDVTDKPVLPEHMIELDINQPEQIASYIQDFYQHWQQEHIKPRNSLR